MKISSLKRTALLLISTFHFSFLYLSGQSYPASIIREDLLKDALIVVRDYSEEFELQTVNSGTCKIHSVYTILAKEGEALASLQVPYDKDSKVKVTQIILYDKTGKKIRSVKQSEIADVPAVSSFELYSEDRVISYEPLFSDFPYTIEYNYEITFSNLISFGAWAPQDDYSVSVGKASLKINYPDAVKINRKELRVGQGKKETIKDRITETWELEDLPAIVSEPLSTSILDRVPAVYLMPSVIQYQKYSGSSDDWKSYGQWLFNLYQGRNKLPDAAIQKINDMVKDIPDTLTRIKVLYEYLQKNTRYVSITMGIGGFQPFGAETVFNTGYGDCKALSNYMSSLLNVIGVRSYPAIVAAGRYIKDIFTDFPNFKQFNHVILCVPFRRDTIWLECTDPNMPFGFLGDFTDQRKVLLVTENGGIFANTPAYNAASNLMSEKSLFSLSSTGRIEGSVTSRYTGLQYDDMSDYFDLSNEDLKKWYYGRSSLPALQIRSIVLKNNRGRTPCAELGISLNSDNFASLSGNYLILPLNRVNYMKPIQKMLKTRQSDIVISRSYIDSDSIIYTLPSGYRPESLPAPVNLESEFGTCSFIVTYSGDNLICARNLMIRQGRYKPEMYGRLYDFILAVSKADNGKILLIK